jgi:hypothetical protein
MTFSFVVWAFPWQVYFDKVKERNERVLCQITKIINVQCRRLEAKKVKLRPKIWSCLTSLHAGQEVGIYHLQIAIAIDLSELILSIPILI